MTTLYILYASMLALALALIAIPTLKQGAAKKFLKLGSLFVFLVLSLFILFGGSHNVQLWLEGGEQHYALLQQVKNLGGMETIFAKLKERVKADPNNPQGWFILGKLYLSNKNLGPARDALTKALSLDPKNSEIKKYYDLAKNANP